MDWVTSILTVVSMGLIAARRWEGWALGLVNQACWLWLIFETRQWGLLLMTAVLTGQCVWAIRTWRRER